MKKVIVGLGEILWDVFPTGKVLGGAPANFAYHASQFGFEGIALSAIGNDDDGREIIAELDKKRLKYLLEITPFATGRVNVMLTNGIPQYEICQNSAWDNIPLTPQARELAGRIAAVCFGTLAQRSPVSCQTINHLLDLVPADAYKIFDINLRQHYYSKDTVHQSLLKSNVLKINDEEVVKVAKLFGFEGRNEEKCCKKLLCDYQLGMVILTKGVAGSYVFTPTETSFCPTPTVDAIDTVGAGDSFTAAFIAALLKGYSLRQSHLLAVMVSAYVCTQRGAMPPLPGYLLVDALCKTC